MTFTVLGKVGARGPAGPASLTGVLQRRLLATLLLDADRPVSESRLLEALWGPAAPPSARRTLHAHVSRLRRRLADAALEATIARHAAGYELRTAGAEVDAVRFDRLARGAGEALAAGDAGRALADLEAALALFRGEALAGCHGTPLLDGEARRLEELRLRVIELRLEALLALGREHEAIAELERLTAEHPVRERLWQLLMLALYRCDRQADALAAFARAREHLVGELGIEPGPALRALQAAVLAHDPALLRSRPPAAVAGLGALQARKLAFLFDAIDSDGDGRICREDFRRHAAQLAALQGAEEGSPEAEAIFGEELAWWERVYETRLARLEAANGARNGERPADPDGAEAHASLEDWLAFWTAWLAAVEADAARGGGPALEQLKRSVEKTVDTIDVDGDGSLTLDEYAAWLAAWGITAEPSRSFAVLDADGDGRLTRGEAVQLGKEFFLTNDPEAPGNHLYGLVFEAEPAH
jgi:DNA-binding SARP family transcriptional activator